MLNEKQAYEFHRRSKIGGLLFILPVSLVILVKSEIGTSYITLAISVFAVAAIFIRSNYGIAIISGLIGAYGFILKDRFSSELAGYVCFSLAVLGFFLFFLVEERQKNKSR